MLPAINKKFREIIHSRCAPRLWSNELHMLFSSVLSLVKGFVAGLHLYFTELCSYLQTFMWWCFMGHSMIAESGNGLVWFGFYQRCLEDMERGPLYSWLILNYYQSIFTKLVENARCESKGQNILGWWVWDGWAGLSFSFKFPLIDISLLQHV